MMTAHTTFIDAQPRMWDMDLKYLGNAPVEEVDDRFALVRDI